MKFGCAILGAIVLFAVSGCHAGAQITPTSYEVNLSWSAPAACTAAAPCTYGVSRTPEVSGACPATTGTTYALVGTSASQATTFTDTTVAGGTTYCYIAQTEQAGAVSQPSNTAIIVVPPTPLAPTLATPTTGTTAASVAAPTATDMAMSSPMELKAARQGKR